MAEETAAVATESPKQLKVNRREFLNLAWLASLGFILVEAGAVTILFALPILGEGEFGGTFTIGTVEDLPEEGVVPVNFPKGKFWLTRPAEGVLALYKVCTHLGCLYQWQDSLTRFRCPCHGSQFEYDGRYFKGPAPRSLDRFVMRVVDPVTGEVLAETDLETGAPMLVPDNPNAVIEVDTGLRILGQSKGSLA